MRDIMQIGAAVNRTSRNAKARARARAKERSAARVDEAQAELVDVEAQVRQLDGADALVMAIECAVSCETEEDLRANVGEAIEEARKLGLVDIVEQLGEVL